MVEVTAKRTQEMHIIIICVMREMYLNRLKCGNITLCEYRNINRMKYEKGSGREKEKKLISETIRMERK